MFRSIRFRTHSTPSLLLPLNVRSCGHYLLPPKWEEFRNAGTFLQLFWCVRGGGKILLNQETFPFRRGNAFFYWPGEDHCLQSGREPLEYRWLTLDGQGIKNMPELFGFQRFQNPGDCPEDTFDQLDACLQDATARGERRASLRAYEILLQVTLPGGENAFSGHEIHSALLAKAWLEEHFQDARLNITGLSERFHLHRSTLYRIFIKQHGVAPVQYLNRLRLRHAIDLLNTTNLPVADVAVKAGIPDIAYFSRLIRRNTGLSPRAYRLRHNLEKLPTELSSPRLGKSRKMT